MADEMGVELLDKGAMKAAELAWTGDSRLGLYPEQKQALANAILAYLSALPDPAVGPEVVANLRSDAAQLLRMSKATEFGKDLSVRVTDPALLIANMVAAADALSVLSTKIQHLREERLAAELEMAKARRHAQEVQGTVDLWSMFTYEAPGMLPKIWGMVKDWRNRARTAEARIKALEGQIEQAFRDGLAYGSNVKNADADLAWSHSRARALSSTESQSK